MSSVSKTTCNTDYSSDGGEMQMKLGLIIPMGACSLSCKKSWHRKAIHVNSDRIAAYDDQLATEEESKVHSATRFKEYLLERCEKNETIYKLICMLSEIDFKNVEAEVKMKSVVKADQVFKDVMGESLLDLYN